MKICKLCSEEFIVSKKHNNTQIYCSKYCRERDFYLNNKDKHKVYSLKFRRKTKVKCVVCKNIIPEDYRKSGNHWCSDNCKSVHSKIKKEKRLEKAREKSKIAHLKFMSYKEGMGCQICGYKKFGGSLDFHHKDPSQKEIRIAAKHWISNSEKIKKELDKCVLLCKNCHHEEHWRMKYKCLPSEEEK